MSSLSAATKIDKPNRSNLRNVVLTIIPKNFGKHKNRTSQIKIVIIQENIMLFEKDKLLSKGKRMSPQF